MEYLPFAFASGGIFLDGLLLTLTPEMGLRRRTFVLRYPYYRTPENTTTNFLASQGIRYGIAVGGGMGLYFIDNLLGIESNPINFHKGFLYYIGGAGYLGSILRSYVLIRRFGKK